MVRAIVECVDMGVHLRQPLIHPAVQLLYVRLRIKPPGDPALVRYDDGEVAVIVRPANGGGRVLYPAKFFGLLKIASVHIQRPIAVKKDRRAKVPPLIFHR